jgi:hypothetical protein
MIKSHNDPLEDKSMIVLDVRDEAFSDTFGGDPSGR